MTNTFTHRILLAACLGLGPALSSVGPQLFAQASSPSVAPSRQSGAIVGRVQNQVTGRYLNNARVSVKGTKLVALTDQFGKFSLPGVPAGSQVLQVFYTNMDVKEIVVAVEAGETLQQDVALTSSDRYGTVVKLDPFKVAENREMDAEALAINEQRFAPNLKNVIAADALGDVFGSAAGDFMKFLPGIAAEYNNAEVEAVNIRGIGGGLTNVSADGAPIVSGRNAGASRQVDMRTMALNNVSRLEVEKVPTPATPADSLGGSVNFISKSAFERTSAELRVGVSLSGNTRELSLSKSPHGFIDERRRKVQPGFDFTYTLPVTPNFGIVLAGVQSNNYHYQDITTHLWQNSGAGTGATTSNPYYRRFQVLDFPRFTSKEQYSLKADWRVTPNSVLSVTGRWSANVFAESGGSNTLLDAGANGNPNPASGQRLSYGPNFTNGATGRATVTLNGLLQNSVDESIFTGLGYRFDNGTWKIDSSFNYSSSVLVLGPQEGTPFYFANVSARLISPSRLTLSGFGGDRIGSMRAFANNNAEIDLYNIDNYEMFQANTDERTSRLASRYAKVDIARRIERFSFPTELQFGAAFREQTQDIIRGRAVYNFTGTDPSPRPYLYKVFADDSSFLGLRPFPGLSSAGAYAEFAKNPSILTQTTAQVVATEEYSLDRSQFAKEKVAAYYLQGKVRLLDNRLQVLTGVRFEKTDVSGQGLLNDPDAVWVRNANGTFARNAQGARIRKAEAGAVNSLQQLRLVKKERGYSASSSYDGYYPSLHLTYNIKDNFQARLAYARSYGRPDFPDIIPSALVNEFDVDAGDAGDPNAPQGNITVTNTGLKPWTANNYDFSLEYYTDKGGLFSAGVFRKDITDFFGDLVKIATPGDLQALGLDQRYVGWNLRSKFNSGDARITGIELNARHSLRGLGNWGRFFTVFANATKLRLVGNPYASFRSFIPETANFGFNFNYQRLTVQPRFNYRGRNKLLPQAAFGPDGFEYIHARRIVDLSIDYQLTKRFSLNFAAANIFNDILRNDRYGSDTPAYARYFRYGDYGTKFSLGVRGEF